MDIYPISDSPCGGLGADLDALIETVGTTQFHAQFLKTSQALIGSAHIAAFVIDEDHVPKIVLAADSDEESLAYSATNVFVTRFWDQDPMNRKRFSKHALERGIIVKMPADEFERIPYRRDCYSLSGWSSGGINLIERLTLLRQRHEKTIRIDFYRPRASGAYRPEEIIQINNAAGMMLALISRHARSMMPQHTIKSRPSLEKLIRRIAPDLPLREVQVCAGITLGLSSEAIASTLGIGINTVLTYRKRAYARLQISSHNELLRAVFAALPAVGLDDAPQQPWQMPVQTAEPQWHN